MSAWTYWSVGRQGRPKDSYTLSSNPMMEGPWCRFRREARARERLDTAVADSLKALDPGRPIREADIQHEASIGRAEPVADACLGQNVLRACLAGCKDRWQGEGR